MNVLNNMTLRAKLLASFFVMTFLTLLVGIYGSYNIRELNEADTFLYDSITIPLGDIGDVAASFQRLRTIFGILVASNDIDEQGKTIERINVMRKRIVDRLASFEKGVITDEDRNVYARLINARKSFVYETDKVMALVKAGKLDEAEGILHRGEGRKAAIEYQEEMDRIMEYMVAKAKQTSDANNEQSRQVTLCVLS